MQIDLKETIKNMLLSRMMQYNSNIASVTVSGVVNEYLDTLTKRLQQNHLFTDDEFASLVNLSLKIKVGDFNLNIDQKLRLLKANSDVTLVHGGYGESVSEDVLIEIANSFNSIVIPYPTVMLNGTPLAVTRESFKSSADLLDKLRTAGKYYVFNVYKNTAYISPTEIGEIYTVAYIKADQSNAHRPSSLPKMSQRELDELKKMGFETDNLTDNINLSGEDDE